MNSICIAIFNIVKECDSLNNACFQNFNAIKE